MECNRDEALRAKSIAEGRLENKDYAGARKFAIKARNLYPDLDGISQMLTTLDVYRAAETKIGGEVDWYGVLSVNPMADDEALKKQYRKLALLLHPDKNSSVGADGAFKLISEAWGFLSDKANRSEYNKRRSCTGFLPHLQVPASRPAPTQVTEVVVPAANFRTNRTTSVPKTKRTASAPKASKTTSAPKPRNNGVKAPQKSAPPASADTFWTSCRGCNTHYEYVKMYLNCTLLCPSCNKPFFASATGPPPQMKKRRTG